MTKQVHVSSDHKRTDLSAEQERRYRGPIDGPLPAGCAIAGENDKLYTGPECPTRRQEDEVGGEVSAASAGPGPLSALPSSDQTRI